MGRRSEGVKGERYSNPVADLGNVQLYSGTDQVIVDADVSKEDTCEGVVYCVE